MVDTNTPNLNLIIQGLDPEDIWGAKNNQNFSTLDTIIPAISGSLQSQIDNIQVTDSSKAIIGSDGITVTSGSNTINVAGFRSEFVSASGSLQTQIDAVESSDVDSITASGTTIDGAITLQGLGSVSLHPSGQTIVISGSPIGTGGSGSSDIDDINGITSGSISIQGAGSTTVSTLGQTITVSGGNESSSYLHVQSSASSEWEVAHFLNTQFPAWAAYKSTGEGFIPKNVVPSGLNYVRVFCQPASSGYMRVTVGGGAAGDQGNQGDQGPIGVSGTPGISGAIGPAGPQGTTGNTGPTGPQGPSGAASLEQLDLLIIEPANRNYTLSLDAKFATNITEFTHRLDSGTVSGTLKIAGVPIPGCSNIQITTSETTSFPTSASGISVGDEFILSVSGVQNADSLSVSIASRRVN